MKPLVLFVVLAGAPQAAAAQDYAAAQGSAAAPAEETRRVVPGPQYQRGGLHRTLLGAHYRDLWTAPVTAPVLDLRTFAGGLTPDELGGGQQTRSLDLKGEDGVEQGKDGEIG